MQRIDDATAAPSLPSPEAAGTPGYFTEGNPTAGTPATNVRGSWLNMVQEELIAVVAAGGLTPSKTTYTQLRDAIKAMVGPGRLIGVQVFTSSGTYTPTSGMSTVIFEVQGGGGGGGGATVPSAGNVSLGSPGTSGAYATGRFTSATVGASQTVTIGNGGPGQSGAGGFNGGNTSVGSLISANGGIGGTIFNNVTPPIANGNSNFSSTVTGANLYSIAGSAPFTTLGLNSTQVANGAGGSSKFGSAATGNFGFGGIGIAARSIDSIQTGGTGGKGVVIAWEYS